MIEHVWRVACDGRGCGGFGPIGGGGGEARHAAVRLGYAKVRRVAGDRKVTFRWRGVRGGRQRGGVA